jgi:hypothetical protein
MPRPRRCRPKSDRRRALELLASRDGCSEVIIVAHGFTIEILVELVRVPY